MDRLKEALAGRYVIEREIGAGGMAIVYLAEDVKHRRKVAIKVLRHDLAATIGSDRFLREIEIAARLSHPHILPLFDSGAAGDLLYYVMPFVPGESLRSRLSRERQLPMDEALRLTREVASALGFAHQSGIVHRDIKPENILLADGIALVADFGIARALRSSRESVTSGAALTIGGFALGTPTYMSPEQFTAEEVDARSDLYSLGCVLYEMLAGEPPFAAPSIDGLLRKHLTAEPRPVSEVRPTVPTGIARIVSRSLAKDPAERFQTAAQMAEAIATVMSGGLMPGATDTAIDIPNNLPRQRTRFIGRDRELAECARLLGETRLLTLTGIGGSGKTRLALRLADSMLPTFPDGVWLADLAPLVDPANVPATVAEAIGATASADKPIMDAIRERIRGKRALILLDNCEHLLGAAAELADALLSTADSVRMIATSREGLGIEGERLFAVRSMSVPADPGADLRALEAFDAVRLFVDRAQSARRDFVLGADNAAAIAEICRRLDGIPLALELAAARVKVLSVEQIRSRLDDRFRLLTGGRSAVPRQQTLLATIQWSYEQLTEPEQRLLRQLSVFTGGWTLESATAVAGEDADEFEILDLLTHLVDKSLVQVEQAGASEARYGMLESVRQYGQERLIEAGEADDTRERHLAEFMRLGELYYDNRFANEEPWNQRLTSEMDNLRAALSFVRTRDPERYLSFVGSIAYFWWARSHIVEGREHVRAAMAQSSPRPFRRSYARALRGHGMLTAFEGNDTGAREAMNLGLAMWRELGDPIELGNSLATLGWAQFLASEDEDAYVTFDELLRVTTQLGDPVLVNQAKVGLGQVLVALARVDEARVISREIIEYSSKAGDRRAEHSGYHYLADCALIAGDCEESIRLYGESLVLANAIGDRLETSFEIEGIAMSLAGLGDHEKALRLRAAAREEWARHGVAMKIRFWDALVASYFAPAEEALGTDRTAAATKAGAAMSFEDAVAEALAAARR